MPPPPPTLMPASCGQVVPSRHHHAALRRGADLVRLLAGCALGGAESASGTEGAAGSARRVVKATQVSATKVSDGAARVYPVTAVASAKTTISQPESRSGFGLAERRSFRYGTSQIMSSRIKPMIPFSTRVPRNWLWAPSRSALLSMPDVAKLATCGQPEKLRLMSL